MILVRSLLFNLVLWFTTVVYSLLTPLLLPFPKRARYRIVSSYARLNTQLLWLICGVRYRVHGAENLPTEGSVVYLSKHQSAWETLGFQAILTPHSWVLKRELLWIPFLGLGLWMMQAIAIDRKAGRKALKVMVEEGRRRLDSGLSMLIFPEGTRIAPGKRGQYHAGGALLASKCGVPIVPIAHNAGELWPRQSFLKYPGTIDVVIGTPLESGGRSANELIGEAEKWIEGQMDRINGQARRAGV